MSQYIQMKEKLLDVFKDRNIESSFEELAIGEAKIIDFSRPKDKYKGRAFVLKYSQEKAYGVVRFNNKTEDLQIEFLENEIEKYFSMVIKSETGFLPIDGKGTIMSGNESCCDFVFFDFETFYFCEFKVFAISEKYLTIQKNRKDAINQLVKTIGFFDKNLAKNYCGLRLQSCLISPPHFPKFNPDIQQMRISFLEKYGIELDEKYCS